MRAALGLGMTARRFLPPWSVAEGAPLSEVGRFNASSTIPVHGASPWLIVETPPDTTPDDAGDPSRVVFCLDGPSE